jgi:hypothetical protein
VRSYSPKLRIKRANIEKPILGKKMVPMVTADNRKIIVVNFIASLMLDFVANGAGTKWFHQSVELC